MRNSPLERRTDDALTSSPSLLGMKRFWDKVDVRGPDECWEWTSYRVDGYGRFWLGCSMLAHRVSWILTHSDPGDICVLHRCDNPPCVNPTHLFLGTRQDNNRDKIEKGRDWHPTGTQHWMRNQPEKINRGEQCPQSKVTEDDVRAIRKDQRLQRIIAWEYGISQAVVSKIQLRQSWIHVKDYD